MAFHKIAFFVGLFTFLATWQAWGKVQVTMQDSVKVYRGQRAEIPCAYTVSKEPSAVVIQWFVAGESGSGRQRVYYGDDARSIVEQGTDLAERIRVTRSASGSVLLAIQDVHLTDECEFICQVNGRSAGSQEARTQLRVFAAPETPVIEAVYSGISVTSEDPSKIASCEARNGYPIPRITWYRDRTPLRPVDGQVRVETQQTQESSGLLTVKSELFLKVNKEDKDAEFYCEASYDSPDGMRMSESRVFNITVHYPTTAVELRQESPTGLVKEGDLVLLRCSANGNPAPPFTFHRIRQEEGEEVEEDLSSELDLLVLRDVSRADTGVYRCRSLDLDSYTDYADYVDVKKDMSLHVHYLDPPKVVPKAQVLEEGESLMATCNALSSLDTHTVWLKDGQQVDEGHRLELQDVSFNTSGEYVCQVTVPSLPGLQSTASLHISVRGPPKISEPESTALEESVEKWINLSCEAWGFPKPSLTWSSTGAQNWHEVSHRETDNLVQSVVSFTVTSDLTASCNATNDFGTDTKFFSIRAIPLTTTSSTKVTVTVPPPKRVQKEGSGVIIAVIIICILLLAILGSVLYFLYKKGKLPCGRSGKQDIKEKVSKDDIVEMMSDKTEEAVLLQGVNGEKKPPADQGEAYLDVQK
ncbi:melanoma cell adhesion molecule b isoform X2 [Megalops cyprinoides]|uniref:melanoma cell adhesion molecule b isoform X2 n=1 Tax=Megalops cyprinoides TaxID=118141 RepID=UPI001864563A|nr:melanoma cell adhesion molecule b isoform X2 [Megalops cyprinoides]